MNIIFLLSFLGQLAAVPDSTIDDLSLEEVTVVAVNGSKAPKTAKGASASIDEHLQQLSHVNLVRRGSYAWEPVVNNMSTERVSTTIDGMKIFYACTDKMDPVTSYVESGNLQSISLNSGLDGNPQSTGNIGGSIDMKLRKVGFDATPRAINLSSGFEGNGNLQVYGADAAFSSHNAYTNAGVFYRHADNYKAGKHTLIDYSQFQKVNVFVNFGFRLAERKVLEGTVIYDRATDVGYPALNMDVGKAEGIITSLSYRQTFDSPLVNAWETKVYYNHITHEMDDTKRPDVLIHMDMPGRSETAGLYSILYATAGVHDVRLNYDLYYNNLFADMTMYPEWASPMYMVTWPGVGTLNTGVALTDNISLPHSQSLHFSAKTSWQRQHLGNEEGYSALRVFFPDMKRDYQALTGRVAAKYAWQPGKFTVNIGTGWGSRAPTVTEAYGYYLNNTFDRFDYIGNPRLSNESAIEANILLRWHSDKFSVSAEANAFFFSNYIIGEREARLSAMTLGAEGVKVYANQKSARIINTSLSAEWRPLTWLDWNGEVSYAQGRDGNDATLPLIAPFSYHSSVKAHHGRWGGELGVRGAARQVDFAPQYGESETPAYSVWNLSVQYRQPLRASTLTLRAGIENISDKLYSTYSDWNSIPQKGRNIYLNIAWSL